MKKIFLVMAAIFALSACGDNNETPKNADEKPVVKIGAILPLTGGAAQIGEAARNGALLAIDDANRKPDNKYSYKLIYEDIGLEPAKTVPVYKKMAEYDGISALVSFNTAVGRILKPAAAADRLLHISSATDNEIPDNGYNWVNSYSIADFSDTLVEYMRKNDMKTIALLSVNHTSTESVMSVLVPILEKSGIEVIADEKFNVEQRDFRAESQKIIRAKPDMVFIHTFEPMLSLVGKQLLADGYTGQEASFMMFAYADHKEVFAGKIVIDLADGNSEFNKEYESRYAAKPLMAAINTYDNIQIIVDFIERHGLPKEVPANEIRQDIMEILKNLPSAGGGKMLVNSTGLIYSSGVVKVVKE